MIHHFSVFCYSFECSEEIFDFAEGKMTVAKTNELKQQFNSEFSMIYQLCEVVLINSKKPQLLVVALDALLGFLSWIPIGYVFKTKMVQLLIDRVCCNWMFFIIFCY